MQVGQKEPEDKKLLWMRSDPITGGFRIEWYSHVGWRPIWQGSGSGSGIEEAPIDSNQYTRGQGRWNILHLSDITNALSQLRTDLESEIERSMEVEGSLLDDISDLNSRLETEISRATSAETSNLNRINIINGLLDVNVITGISYTATSTGIIQHRTFRNLYTGVPSDTVEAIPIVSNTTAGIVLPDLFNTIVQNTQRITNLEQSSGAGGNRRLGVFSTKSDLDNFTLPADAKAGDTAVVTNDETHSNYATEYGLSSTLSWVYLFTINTTTSIATNTSVGTVKGSLNTGQIAIETDGSMSVVGWDNLESSIPTNVSQLINDAGYLTNIDINIQDATSDIKGVATLGAAGGAARYGQKSDVGLSNVDNTSDANKPISNSVQTALNNKQGLLTQGSGISIVNNVISASEEDPQFNTWKNSPVINLGTFDELSWTGTGMHIDTSSNNGPLVELNTTYNDTFYYLAADGRSIGLFARDLNYPSDSAVVLNPNIITLRSQGNIRIAKPSTGKIILNQQGTLVLLDENNKIPTERLMVWYGTQAEYDGIVTKDPNIEYNIYED